jgi:prepilin-type N-terminal cleavage/methylation domain-containing protein
MEWNHMELIDRRKARRNADEQSGMTMIELMIAMVVLAFGVVGSMALVVRAIGGDTYSKQLSNNTVMAETVLERVMSIQASNSTIVTITDCAGTAHNVSTAAGGAALLSSGDVDFSQAAVTNYQMSYTDCGTNGQKSVYDVRWNITAISNYAKLLVVSAQLTSAGNSRMVYAPEVTLRTVVGQGT